MLSNDAAFLSSQIGVDGGSPVHLFAPVGRFPKRLSNYQRRGKGEIQSDFLVDPSAPWRLHLALSLHPCSAPSVRLTSCITHSLLLERLRGGGSLITSKIEKLPSIITVGLALQGRASARA
jgi:hypothetical protein